MGIRARLAEERGSTAELAVATPLLLLLVLLVVQFALYWDASHVAQASASETLAAARVRGGSVQAGQAEARSVLSQLAGGLLADPTVQVTRGRASVQVRITGTAEAVVPFLRLPVRATASGPVERFVPDPGQFSNSEGPPASNPRVGTSR